MNKIVQYTSMHWLSITDIQTTVLIYKLRFVSACMCTCKTMDVQNLVCKNWCEMNDYRYPACPKSRVNSSKCMRSAALTVGCVFCKALMKSCKVSLGSSNLSLGTCIHVISIPSGSCEPQGVNRSSTVMLGSLGEGPLAWLWTSRISIIVHFALILTRFCTSIVLHVHMQALTKHSL